MSSRRSRLLAANSVTTLAFVFLLAVHLFSVQGLPPGSTAHTVTANGNAQISTAQSKFGGASGLFDGSGDYLSTPASSDWAFGSGDFTIDFWVWFTSLPTASEPNNIMMLYSQYVDDDNRICFGLYNTGSYNWLCRIISGGTGIIRTEAAAQTITTSTWYHVAWVRSAGTWYVFQGGVQCGTGSVSGSAPSLSAPLLIGRYRSDLAYELNGRLDEYRVSKGVARWTSGFTPPSSAYTADTSTVLLLHMDGTNGSTIFTDDCVMPSGPDFSINASPTSQSVGAGSSASYTLSLTSTGGYSGTVSLSVTSGLPSGATGTITPDSVGLASGETKTATLSISTDVVSTPAGTSSVVVTATDGSKTHTATVTLVVSAAGSYSFNVKAGATQVVVTLTYSWSGSGSLPLGNITIGPGSPPSPLYKEPGAVVYDRTLITVTGGTNTYSIIHRATFTISAPGSAQTWTALISLAGVSSYNVAIEVS